MTTYASPRLTKGVLQLIITLIFLVGALMLATLVIDTINHISQQKLAERGNNSVSRIDANKADDVIDDDDDHDHDSTRSPEMDTADDDEMVSIDIDNSRTPAHPVDHQPDALSDDVLMFPSVSSISVRFMFAGITMGHAMFGIIAITHERANLLTTYSHILFLSSFIKLLFLIASACMHTNMSSRKFMTTTSLLAMMTAIVELILIMCTCQMARLVKRGDAARQEIQSLHSYQAERRGRQSRSQSRARSYHNLPYSVSQISINRGVSQEYYSYQDGGAINPGGEYCAPPIYLKLDR